MKNIIHEVRNQLQKNADPAGQISGKRFFKEEIKLYGLKSALVSKIGKESFSLVKYLSKPEIFSYCDELWQSGFIEECIIACNWSYYIHKQYKPEDIAIFERWLDRYVNNWACWDTLCNHTIGQFVEMYPFCLSDIKSWAVSDNRWMRRGSAVSLIIPARKGKFLEDIFEIADILLMDADDLVQKGYGWMLKAASESHQQEVFEFVIRNKGSMPRTALRYAIEKMPSELRQAAMKK